jgi:hypothetical protein
LDGVIRPLEYKNGCSIVHFVHPEFLRIQPNDEKSQKTISQLSALKSEMQKYV